MHNADRDNDYTSQSSSIVCFSEIDLRYLKYFQGSFEHKLGKYSLIFVQKLLDIRLVISYILYQNPLIFSLLQEHTLHAKKVSNFSSNNALTP